MTKLLVTDAIIRARKLGFIARENAAGTRLWFYTGEESNKWSWLEAGHIPVNGATVLLSDFERVTA